MFKRIAKMPLRYLFIKTEDTPNPNFLKFVPAGKSLMETGSYDFPSVRQAMGSPLAKSIFLINGVNRVFYGRDYISVGKTDGTEWQDVKPHVYAAIEQFFNNGDLLFLEKIDIPVS